MNDHHKYDFQKKLSFAYDATWEEVFAIWRIGEAHQDSWKSHWKERGFDSWDAWRKDYISAIPCDVSSLSWEIYEVNDMSLFLDMYGVPSRGWREKCYEGEVKKLNQILDHPIVIDNSKIDACKERFPLTTMITGLVVGNEIVLIEGMHRALAIATDMGSDEPCFENSAVALALARVPEGMENNIMNMVLGKG